MPQRTIYAVLAGINEYPAPVKPLKGCMYDVDMWEKYLKGEESHYHVIQKVLRNSEVTKRALTDALRESLESAKSGDIVFFFYSGHGTRETADPVFADIEQDKALESLVCHDSIKYNSGKLEFDLLSDKEVHYLLSAYGNDDVHILTIFDCCHSGSITRNMFLSAQEEEASERRYVPTERLSFVAPMRNWEQFIFSNTVSRDQVESMGWLRAVPQRRHITLSACQNDESAFEQGGKGIFTANMHDVLTRTGGALSYYDLQSRVRLFTQNQFRQTPEIYAVRNYESDLLRTFLDKPVVQKDFGCTCYLKKDTGWVIDLGAIHGISSYSGPVVLYDEAKTYEVSLGQIFSHYAKIEVTDELKTQLKAEVAYRGALKFHFSGATTFFIEEGNGSTKSSSKLKDGVNAFLGDKRGPFAIADTQPHAGYLIRTNDNSIRICNNDDGLRPATEVPLHDPDAVAKTIQYMRHIAQWEYIRTLCNPDFKTTEYPVEIMLYRMLPDGKRQELAVEKDLIEFDYDKNAGGELTGKLKVSISNKSKVKYYCAILYLSNEFQVYGNMLDGKVIGLSAGETAWVYNGDEIELLMEQHIVEFNYPYSTFYLKLLANPEPLQVDTLEQSALPAPTDKNKRGFGDPASRGLLTREEAAVGRVQWFSRTLCFKGRNPFYKESFK